MEGLLLNFLEKLCYLMEKNKLNRHSLSVACGIPYNTINSWYKQGYEGLKLTSLRKLADFFDTSLDFWVKDGPIEELELDEEVARFLEEYRQLSESDRKVVRETARRLLKK